MPTREQLYHSWAADLGYNVPCFPAFVGRRKYPTKKTKNMLHRLTARKRVRRNGSPIVLTNSVT